MLRATYCFFFGEFALVEKGVRASIRLELVTQVPGEDQIITVLLYAQCHRCSRDSRFECGGPLLMIPARDCN